MYRRSDTAGCSAAGWFRTEFFAALQQPCSLLVSDVGYRKRNDDPSYLPRLHSFSLVSITYYIPRISTDYFDTLSRHTYDVVVIVCLFWYTMRLAGPGWKSRGHQADSTTPRREDTVFVYTSTTRQTQHTIDENSGVASGINTGRIRVPQSFLHYC